MQNPNHNNNNPLNHTFVERYVLKTPKFYLGIEALRDSSPLMCDIFAEAPIPRLQDVEDDKSYENWALFALLDTIKASKPITIDVLQRVQRVTYVAKDAVDYVNREGIPLSWRKETSDGKDLWVFWVLLPKDYQEKCANDPMGKRLEINGFVREPLTV